MTSRVTLFVVPAAQARTGREKRLAFPPFRIGARQMKRQFEGAGSGLAGPIPGAEEALFVRCSTAEEGQVLRVEPTP
jgi:hypothetical protein